MSVVMAKNLLLNALHEVLADYVVDLSPEKLKVGVWSGKIVLNELQVRAWFGTGSWFYFPAFMLVVKDHTSPVSL